MQGQTVEVFARTRFTALHYWPKAPDEVAYLRDPHRHEFHVQVNVAAHLNTTDPIALNHYLEVAIAQLNEFHVVPTTWSCDRWATEIYQTINTQVAHDGEHAFHITRIEVSEDGENGGVVTWS